MSRKVFWDTVSPIYSRFMRNNEGVYRKSCRKITPYLSNGMKMLELGCGTGEFTGMLSESVGDYTASDFSEGMVRRCYSRLNGRGVRFKVEDAMNLSFGSESFDAVLIANALHVVPDPERVLQEIHRVLKRGGLLLAPTFIFNRNTTKIRVRLLEMIGFKVYNKWSGEDLLDFVTKYGFEIISQDKIEASPLSELVLISRKI